MYQPGFFESMQLIGESNIKICFISCKAYGASVCGLSSVIGDLGPSPVA
jgi:hypothetical protein